VHIVTSTVSSIVSYLEVEVGRPSVSFGNNGVNCITKHKEEKNNQSGPCGWINLGGRLRERCH